MTKELEKQFFDTFGIEPKFKGYSNTEELSTGGVIPCGNIKYFNTIEEMDKANYWCFNMWELGEEDKEYPQITDRILLGIIAKIMWSYSCTQNDFDAYEAYEVSTVDNLKEAVLKHAIELSKNDDYVYCGVRTLFEEG